MQLEESLIKSANSERSWLMKLNESLSEFNGITITRGYSTEEDLTKSLVLLEKSRVMDGNIKPDEFYNFIQTSFMDLSDSQFKKTLIDYLKNETNCFDCDEYAVDYVNLAFEKFKSKRDTLFYKDSAFKNLNINKILLQLIKKIEYVSGQELNTNFARSVKNEMLVFDEKKLDDAILMSDIKKYITSEPCIKKHEKVDTKNTKEVLNALLTLDIESEDPDYGFLYKSADEKRVMVGKNVARTMYSYFFMQEAAFMLIKIKNIQVAKDTDPVKLIEELELTLFNE